ncbi:MAG: hypothetical protein RLZZ450_6205 [Pseudomonadota bacterium]|jgi:hypothetical protein
MYDQNSEDVIQARSVAPAGEDCRSILTRSV